MRATNVPAELDTRTITEEVVACLRLGGREAISLLNSSLLPAICRTGPTSAAATIETPEVAEKVMECWRHYNAAVDQRLFLEFIDNLATHPFHRADFSPAALSAHSNVTALIFKALQKTNAHIAMDTLWQSIRREVVMGDVAQLERFFLPMTQSLGSTLLQDLPVTIWKDLVTTYADYLPAMDGAPANDRDSQVVRRLLHVIPSSQWEAQLEDSYHVLMGRVTDIEGDI
ncbi:hypothetical protein SISSUDRAFT_865150 [Sistotremastrum suecicum HHB10207 ss-3]|uniref:Uncharacterized protein n=1 Tax=Sistotremastrum suecicum HHB10207 ss-3 TaxID=1314776 RepID=A0A166CFY6_9AGAM|nr:hypothetical protein SISSUDRAFT_865150 [Sistotremastrum suecicum HHB10207 ss-3]